jgi:hypothetical protein
MNGDQSLRSIGIVVASMNAPGTSLKPVIDLLTIDHIPGAGRTSAFWNTSLLSKRRQRQSDTENTGIYNSLHTFLLLAYLNSSPGPWRSRPGNFAVDIDDEVPVDDGDLITILGD